VEAQNQIQRQASRAPEEKILQEMPVVLETRCQLSGSGSVGPRNHNLPEVWSHRAFALQAEKERITVSLLKSFNFNNVENC